MGLELTTDLIMATLSLLRLLLTKQVLYICIWVYKTCSVCLLLRFSLSELVCDLNLVLYFYLNCTILPQIRFKPNTNYVL